MSSESNKMIVVKNPTLDRLKQGKLAIGAAIKSSRTIDVAKALKASGFDWMFIDLEHGTVPLDFAAQLCVAADDVDITPIARVPSDEYSMATRLLDNGAKGIVIPHVETAAQAQEVVQRLKYPPQGKRSVGPTPPHVGFRPVATKDFVNPVNDSTLIIVMIETALGVQNAREIAAVPGIDILLIGSNDLCHDMGITSQFDSPQLMDAYARVIAACQEFGKWAGMGGVYNTALMPRYIEAGARFVLAGADQSFMLEAAVQRASFLHDLEGKVIAKG
jgi:4-hydroxy-2-oxoheptanedioate aldolase